MLNTLRTPKVKMSRDHRRKLAPGHLAPRCKPFRLDGNIIILAVRKRCEMDHYDSGRSGVE
jgi:hypothetical protein